MTKWLQRKSTRSSKLNYTTVSIDIVVGKIHTRDTLIAGVRDKQNARIHLQLCMSRTDVIYAALKSDKAIQSDVLQ
jgi:hypothetical protein